MWIHLINLSFNFYICFFLLVLLSISSIVSIFSIFLMVRVSQRRGIDSASLVIIMPFILGGLSLLVSLDIVNFILTETSVFLNFFNKEIWLMATALAVTGMAIDFGGIYLTKLWDYPPVSRKRSWYVVYIIMWSVFGFCMQLTWSLVSLFSSNSLVTFLLVSLLGMIAIEIPNTFGYAWVYKGIFRKPVFLYLGWFLLTLTNVVWIVKFIVNPLNLIV